MKILHVTPLYYPSSGGAQRHVKEVSDRLVSRGHQVTILTTNAKDDRNLIDGIEDALPKIELIDGVSVFRLRASPGLFAMGLDGLVNLRGGYRLLSALLTAGGLEMLSLHPRSLDFVRSIIRSDADLVASWNWYWPPAYHVYLARRLRRFQLVGFPLFHTEERWVQRSVYDRMVAVSDALVVNTSHERDFILRRAPAARNVVVAGVGVDPTQFARRQGNAFRTRHALGSGPLIGFVGRMSPNKGVDKVVEAMGTVWDWNKDVRLVLAGSRTNNFPRLDTLLHRLAPHERARVLMLPNFSEREKADLYDSLDVFVLPSIGESFGIAYLEAWMCHKPVIGSRIGSTSCVIEDGVDGMLVDPNDPSDIARAIIHLLADPHRRVQMGERGHAKAIEHFTWEKVTDRVEQCFLHLIARTSRLGGMCGLHAVVPR